MPAYNESRTIVEAVRQVLAVDYPVPVELIVVDDGSTDTTPLELSVVDDPRMRIHRHPTNLGKGAAVRSGVQLAGNTHVLPFDADLEYSPDDVPRLLAPVLAGRCDVVYGTRLFGANTVYQSYRYAMGNRITTLVANLLFDSYLSDLHSCLKLVPRELLRRLPLRETGFGLDTEITASLLRNGIRPFEVPVSYHSRSHAEGKKISWRDGVACLQILGRVRFARGRRSRLRRTVAVRSPMNGHEMPARPLADGDAGVSPLR
jgi:glycosyltransferase involved in cell wall biosynthesis